MPPPPEIVSAISNYCGRSILVGWNSPDIEYEIRLKSLSDRTEKAAISKSYFSQARHYFDGLTSNTVYEVQIRGRNSYGFGPWAKKQLRTKAGMVK